MTPSLQKKGKCLGKDDCRESPLAIFNNYLYLEPAILMKRTRRPSSL